MKKFVCVFCSVIMILLCGTLTACGGNEELTDSEKTFVGTWVLEDITYFDGKTQLWYPSDSDTFNALCEQYLNKTKIVFGDSKKDGKISGTLTVGNVETSFKWHGTEAPRIINFSNLLTFTAYNGNILSDQSTDRAMKNTKGKLCINPNDKMIYIFKEA